ncbi:unnamed protein product, partial [marine sediment metagenome]
DMTRSKYIIDIVEDNRLYQNATMMGNWWTDWMASNIKSDKIVGKYRSAGLLLAFDCDTKETRNKLLDIMYNEYKLIGLGAGDTTVRFRPNLAVSHSEMEDGFYRTKSVIEELD